MFDLEMQHFTSCAIGAAWCASTGAARIDFKNCIFSMYFYLVFGLNGVKLFIEQARFSVFIVYYFIIFCIFW